MRPCGLGLVLSCALECPPTAQFPGQLQMYGPFSISAIVSDKFALRNSCSSSEIRAEINNNKGPSFPARLKTFPPYGQRIQRIMYVKLRITQWVLMFVFSAN